MQRWAALAFILALPGCVGVDAPASDPAETGAETRAGNGVLEGSVVDENFVPIQAARVLLNGTAYATTTSWNGHFRFVDLEPRLYALVVEAVGWSRAEIDVRVQSDRATRVTLFLDPAIVLEPYSTVQTIRGEITCLDVEAAGPTSLTCEPKRYATSFPPDWAALVTEVTWGPSGFSTATLAQVTAEHADEDGARELYAYVTSNKPARITLQPGAVHADQGGTDATPAQGAEAPLELTVRKDPLRPVSAVGVAFTLQQTFEIFHTTFYYEAPEDLDEYTAMPGG